MSYQQTLAPYQKKKPPGATGLTKPKSQPPHVKLGKHPHPPASPTKLATYDTRSFAGRPLTGPPRQPNRRGTR